MSGSCPHSSGASWRRLPAAQHLVHSAPSTAPRAALARGRMNEITLLVTGVCLTARLWHCRLLSPSLPFSSLFSYLVPPDFFLFFPVCHLSLSHPPRLPFPAPLSSFLFNELSVYISHSSCLSYVLLSEPVDWSFFSLEKSSPCYFFQRALMDFSPRESVVHREAVKHGPGAGCRAWPSAPSSSATVHPSPHHPPLHAAKLGLGSLKLFSPLPQTPCWEGHGLAAFFPGCFQDCRDRQGKNCSQTPW